MNIPRPRFFELEPREARRALDKPGQILQEKLDGRWHVAEIGGNVLVGELMKSGFVPFDIPSMQGQDIRREPLTFRLQVLRDESRRLGLPQIATGHGVEFFETILARGGEGVVAKPAESYFGVGWCKVKPRKTFDCVVAEKHPAKSSVRLLLDGQDAGWCPVLSVRVFEAITIGEVIEVSAHSRHVSGRLREPGFVRMRFDKSAVVNG